MLRWRNQFATVSQSGGVVPRIRLLTSVAVDHSPFLAGCQQVTKTRVGILSRGKTTCSGIPAP